MNLDQLGKVFYFGDFERGAAAIDFPGGTLDPQFGKRILCEGDSWFSLSAIPSGNLLSHLKFAETTLVYNLASPGDTIRGISDISGNPRLKKLILEENPLTKWDAIFISAGGNDLIGRVNQIICRPSPGAGGHLLDYINLLELANLKIEIQDGYKRIAALRDQSQHPDTPIVTHIYDYPTPREAKAKFLGLIGIAGPWFYPAFKQSDIPQNLWISLTDHVFEWLGGVIIDLSGKLSNFHVITNTRETLTRARIGTTGPDGDWENEIHPTNEGYKKLARVISPELFKILYKNQK